MPMSYIHTYIDYRGYIILAKYIGQQNLCVVLLLLCGESRADACRHKRRGGWSRERGYRQRYRSAAASATTDSDESKIPAACMCRWNERRSTAPLLAQRSWLWTPACPAAARTHTAHTWPCLRVASCTHVSPCYPDPSWKKEWCSTLGEPNSCIYSVCRLDLAEVFCDVGPVEKNQLKITLNRTFPRSFPLYSG